MIDRFENINKLIIYKIIYKLYKIKDYMSKMEPLCHHDGCYRMSPTTHDFIHQGIFLL